MFVMSSAKTIIENSGGMESLSENIIRVEIEGLMPLVIEQFGTGFRGFPLISIAHYGFYRGQRLRDPEIIFEVTDKGWDPVLYRNDFLRLRQEPIQRSRDQKIEVDLDQMVQILKYARSWDLNLRDQGFTAPGLAQIIVQAQPGSTLAGSSF